MNKYQVTTGIYEYSLPGWNKTVFVSIFETKNGKFVKFNNTAHSTSIDDIDEDAVFSKWI
jgi:hypothetical protein